MRVLILCFFAVLAGCAHKPYDHKAEVARMWSLDKQHFLNTITVKDDPLETHIEVNTFAGYAQNWPLNQPIETDFALRGYINKKTGAKQYQVYAKIKNRMEWFFPYQANFGKPLQTAKVKRISSDVNCKKYYCEHYEDVLFMVPETELRRMLTLTPAEIKTKTWQAKIKTKAGHNVRDGFNVNEILAFLEVMDRY